MDLTHRFTVPASLDTTWAAFNDIESVAGCFPGATVTEVAGDDFKGTCKVKLGPIALVYAGTGSFLEKDEAAHRFVVEAKGKDKRGNGTAGATVTASFAEVVVASGDATEIVVVTDLSITGKPAQFGRGVIQDVSDKLLQQFVDCLERTVGAAPEEVPAEGTAAAGAPGPATVPGPTAAAPSADGAAPGAETTAPPLGVAEVPTATRRVPVQHQGDDALNLGATVLPVLAKAYWKQGLAALVVLAVLVRWLRRR
ncbi:SRPBCC family protein [Nocardioides mesophilus]|uniref:SRPBCC family protein n=1 Tax=Nocardioides mesophilus TaxID=433659 RepID=A0A7G9RDY2_9ACTN|nr:SRPBCC family protein [Nocardioides mesophilus]QNN53807.1 SRPBCC family protein [Nocardioides mesophilus]